MAALRDVWVNKEYVGRWDFASQPKGTKTNDFVRDEWKRRFNRELSPDDTFVVGVPGSSMNRYAGMEPAD